jgi:hypothetical protein
MIGGLGPAPFEVRQGLKVKVRRMSDALRDPSREMAAEPVIVIFRFAHAPGLMFPVTVFLAIMPAVMVIVRFANAITPPGRFAKLVFAPGSAIGEQDCFNALGFRIEPALDRNAAVRPQDIEDEVAIVPPHAHHRLRNSLAEPQNVELARKACFRDGVVAVMHAVHIRVPAGAARKPVVPASADQGVIASGSPQDVVSVATVEDDIAVGEPLAREIDEVVAVAGRD